MGIRIGINGFGRIGRNFIRCSLHEPDFDVVAINDITDTKTLAHLLKYDSVLGVLDLKIKAVEQSIVVGDRKIRVTSEKDPSRLSWKELEVDLVIESTGLFTRRSDAEKHIINGARKVIITAPAHEADVTLCVGVNAEKYDPAKHQVISNASCTTHCLAVIAKVLQKRYGIAHGYMTTVHSYTNDQKLLDLPHKDLRRGRAAGLSMIPTTTGAITATAEVIPELKGKLNGISVRVPTPNVSLIDFVVQLNESTNAAEINQTFQESAARELKGILAFEEEPLVSIDYSGNPHSAIVDGVYTTVMGGTLAKVLAWYDNEWGYSCRLRDLMKLVAKSL
ncbi:type I glyceraldehyde-3-phosphate dehydrogenase [bacterium]|nr:type I glyceraldehyde-3-phosphate dehydrogenase [bacterium]